MKTIPGKNQIRCSAQARFNKGMGTVDPQPSGPNAMRTREPAVPAPSTGSMRPCWLTEWELTYELHKLWSYEQLIFNLRSSKTGL
jgi:hypothetical protein